MAEKEWPSKKLLEFRRRRRELEEAGEAESVRRLEFGDHVSRMRQIAGLLQREAAEAAGVTREWWNSLEKGRVPISHWLIPKVARALSLDEARLYRRAGLAAPRGAGAYGLGRAERDFELALLESGSAARFFVHLQVIWMEYKRGRLGGRRHFALDPKHASAFARALDLSSVGRLKLASMIVEGAKGELAKTQASREATGSELGQEGDAYFANPQRLFDRMDLRCGNQ